MPRIRYKTYRPKADARDIIEQANEILVQYDAQGFSLTLRQLYYQFIARDLFPDSWIDPREGTKNNIQNYHKLKNIVANGREGGMIDWDHITDRGRERECHPHWDDPRNFMQSVTPQFRIDLWEDQPTRVEVWVEKDALSEVVGRACAPLDVPYMACKGYISASAVWDAAHNRFLRWYRQYRQNTVVIHLSDHDPSGIDMRRDLADRLDMFSTEYSDEYEGRPAVSVHRIALTMDQVHEYDPPPNPAKETDSRFRAYEQEFGDTSWELDALEPMVIVNMITETVRSYMNTRRFNARRQQERAWRDELNSITHNFDSVIENLPEDNDDEE